MRRLARHVPSNMIGQILSDTTNHRDGTRQVLLMWQDGTYDPVRYADLEPLHRIPRPRHIALAVVALIALCLAIDFLPIL